jgi:hypothetical protein
MLSPLSGIPKSEDQRQNGLGAGAFISSELGNNYF